VEKAREMGMDWWVNNPAFIRESQHDQLADSFANIENRLGRLEACMREEPG
jgi:hypothetical protein